MDHRHPHCFLFYLFVDPAVGRFAAKRMDYGRIAAPLQRPQQPPYVRSVIPISVAASFCVISFFFAFFSVTSRSRSAWVISSCPSCTSPASGLSIGHFYFAQIGHSHFATEQFCALTANLSGYILHRSLVKLANLKRGFYRENKQLDLCRPSCDHCSHAVRSIHNG